MERVTVASEVRAEGRTLEGTVMRFGDYSPGHRERFLPGSLVRHGDTWLDLEHDVSRVIAWEGGGGLSFEETADALTMRAVLPRIPLADLALADIRSGKRTGLSVEFDALRERREAQTGVRLLELAKLAGIGLVSAPSFNASRVELRAGPKRISKRIVNGKVVYGSLLACRCRTGCDRIQIEPGAFEKALAEAEAGERDITAFLSGSFDKPVASVSAGSLKLTSSAEGLAIVIESLPETTAVTDWLASLGAAKYTLRPWFPDDQSTFTVTGTVATFTQADLRAIEIAPIAGPMEGLRELTVRNTRGRPFWL